MFNALGQIFSPPPLRHAEHSDTRQEIQRHDPEFERRRKKQNPQASDEQTETVPIVSVEALLAFLQAFVKKNQPVGIIGENANSTPQTPTAAPASYAASAYQNTARAQQKNTILLETTDSAAQGPEMNLSAADIRLILRLIEDLKLLKAAEIEQLELGRAATFLQSLQDAVNTAKTYI